MYKQVYTTLIFRSQNKRYFYFSNQIVLKSTESNRNKSIQIKTINNTDNRLTNNHRKKRTVQEIANRTREFAHNENFKKRRHRAQMYVVIFCTISGFIFGLIGPNPWDEDDNSYLFNRAEIQHQIHQAFEFRPDYAATMIRAAFVCAARRAGIESELIAESCSISDGLKDVSHIYEFQTKKNHISTEDLVAIGAIEAIRFLKGPAKRIPFYWGRKDIDHTISEDKDTSTFSIKGIKHIASEAAQTISETGTGEYIEDKGRTMNFHKAENPSLEEYLKKSEKSLKSLDSILTAIEPSFTIAEKVALMACHGIGEYHTVVSGLDPCPFRLGEGKRERHTLDNHYFQLLIREDKNFRKYKPPHTMNNNGYILPTMLLTYLNPKSKHYNKDRDVSDKQLTMITDSERNALMNNEDWKKYVELFSNNNHDFEEAFSSAFLKLLNSHCNNLKLFVVNKEIKDSSKDE